MRSISFVILSAILIIGMGATVLYTSCTKDACKGVTCLNQSTCSGGVCGPCPTGVGGVNCEVIYEQQYANAYTGNTSVDSGGVYVVDSSNMLTFTVAGSDSQYTQMQVQWTDPALGTVTFPVTLTTFSATTSSSNFTLGSATLDTNVFTGTGSINSTVASMSLKASHPNSAPTYYTLTNFNRQP